LLLGFADQLVLSRIHINVGERGIREGFPQMSHGFLEFLVEELRDLVVGDRAANVVLASSNVGAVNESVRQATDRPRAVDPEVLSSEVVYALQINFPIRIICPAVALIV
jgi:hypothetical protein